MGSEWSMPPLMPEQGSGAYPTPATVDVPALPSSDTQIHQRLSRPMSVTSALRAHQRAESAQQAISELSVLTEQLLELPERLARTNLARQYATQLHEAMEAFAELARLAWDGLATEKLDEIATTPAYRQRAVAATRRVSRLQQEAAATRPVTDEGLALDLRAPKRVGPLWNRRVRLYTNALSLWRVGLGVSRGVAPHLPTLGMALEELRAAVGLAGMSSFTLVMQRAITLPGIVLGGVIAAFYVSAAACAITLRLLPYANVLTVVALVLMLLWSYSFWLSSVSTLSLWKIMGVVRWRLSEMERDAGLGLLNGWRWFATIVVFLASLGSIAGAGWLLRDEIAPQSALRQVRDLTDVLHLLGSPPVLPTLIVLTTVLLLVPIVVALPATLTYQGLLTRDMAANAGYLPVTRRATLFPALHTLSFHLLLVLALAAGPLVVGGIPWQPFVATAQMRISPFAFVVAAVIIAAYLFLIEVPFRLGSMRWRRSKLAGIATQKRELGTKLNHLGPEPMVVDDVSTMQYDVARLQYLRLQEDDVRRESAAPYGAPEEFAALVIALLTGILAENALFWGSQLLK